MTTTYASKRIRWTKVDSTYYTLDLWSITIHVYIRNGRWTWEILERDDDGDLVDGGSCGSCKLRHHAANSAIRVVGRVYRLDYMLDCPA